MPKYAYETQAQFKERCSRNGGRDPDTGRAPAQDDDDSPDIGSILTGVVVGEALSAAFDSPSSDSSSDIEGGGGDFGGGGSSGDF